MNSYLESSIKQFKYYKLLADKAIDQLTDEQFFWQHDAESNSIAMIVNHITGNMLSRFTDFLTTDGEKPWRNRDAEFETPHDSRLLLLKKWHNAWHLLLDTLSSLTINDLERIIYIRNDGHTVVEAINRQLAHYAYHVGQIVFIAKMHKGTTWQPLSIPKNRSEAYNVTKFNNPKNIRHFTDDLE